MFKTTALLTTAVLAAAATGSAQAVVIYSDSFDGDSATNLVGQAPDTAPGTETWTGFNSNYKADGSLTGGNANAYLAFTPVAGTVYTVSADVTGDGGNWAAFGFAENVVQTAFYSSFDGVSSNGYGNILYYRSNVADPKNPNVYAGAGTGGSTIGIADVPTGTLSLKIVLDATDANSANWTMDFWVNGAEVLSNVSANSGDFGDIGYVGFTNWAGSLSGTIDNFVLEDNTVIPEPGSLALLGLGGLLIGARRRRG